MQYPGGSLIPFLLIIIILQSCTPQPEQTKKIGPELLVSWNERIMQYAIEEDGLLTLKGVRATALMHLAIHDALNAIERRYAPYAFREQQPGVNPLAAAAQAAYTVGTSQFPEKSAELKAALDSCLSSVEDGPAKQAGIELGKKNAALILDHRSGDQWNGTADYTWHPMAPGVYAEFDEHSGTPKGFIFGAGWAVAQPFMLTSPDQFRAPPPPAINSVAYTKAFNEVKTYGRVDSKVRSPDQTHLAMWWKDFVENSHNRLARQLVVREKLDLWAGARLFALLNMTIYDAYINVFDNKFHYNHWRPYTAIRWAAHDGNPDTEANPEWDNLHRHTYAFPSYPSAHGTASSAAMTVLAHTLGTGNRYDFVMTTKEVDRSGPFSEKIAMDPPQRSFRSFSEAGLEAALSRIYLGIHFRYDSEEGHRLGNRIGAYACGNFLTLSGNP